jgi:hypothetical protein
VLAMTMPYSGQGWRHSARPFGANIVVRVEDIVSARPVVHYVFNPDHYIGIVIANTTLLDNLYMPSWGPYYNIT